MSTVLLARAASRATQAAPAVRYPDIKIGWRSRALIRLMPLLLRPWLTYRVGRGLPALARYQLEFAGSWPQQVSGQPLDYTVLGGVGGAGIGDLSDRKRPVLLYLHGGGFLLPIAPWAHFPLFGWLCQTLGATGFMPEYRLAGQHPFPAALDDCERAYRALLDAGHSPERIVIAGESAGGNLTLALLLRLKRLGLPMPACAVPMSPMTDLCHLHSPPSRGRNRRRDPFIPIPPLVHMLRLYIPTTDARNPEVSPIFGDFHGLPPLHFLVGESEVLLDDSLVCVQRAREAGVAATADVWPILPHAFPQLAGFFPEARGAWDVIADFMRRHLDAHAPAGLRRS
ncbi:steryl acetyl hydrolase [Solimonas sp. K1W22B-7]|uniref:alpha/beta hydrolase n=1 Tax=Solimonas sp. K1W22B-7 TaxID=2303331 RepID=UPI000E3373EA|nr:alpha/beta hydrolase fold domain-containing protein [Solimonas sp. K1W22B-7]AXQ31122.1 steryl acetyl hydrolase [Solimonas sp. K1W22B-7]